MRIYIYFLIFIFIISCSANNGVYWCGDHACANSKEKKAYFKKTMIVEVRNSDKNNEKILSTNEIILNQSESNEQKEIITDNEFNKKNELEKKQMEKNEKIIEEQIELQEKERAKEEKERAKEEKERAKQEKELKEEIKLEENQNLSVEKIKEQPSSSFDKIVEIKEIRSKNFDEIVEKILMRNSSRSFPKINDIPK